MKRWLNRGFSSNQAVGAVATNPSKDPTGLSRGARFVILYASSTRLVRRPRLQSKHHRSTKPLLPVVRGFRTNVISKDGHGTTACGDEGKLRAIWAVPDSTPPRRPGLFGAPAATEGPSDMLGQQPRPRANAGCLYKAPSSCGLVDAQLEGAGRLEEGVAQPSSESAALQRSKTRTTAVSELQLTPTSTAS